MVASGILRGSVGRLLQRETKVKERVASKAKVGSRLALEAKVGTVDAAEMEEGTLEVMRGALEV